VIFQVIYRERVNEETGLRGKKGEQRKKRVGKQGERLGEGGREGERKIRNRQRDTHLLVI
jgi:hypothetical protein